MGKYINSQDPVTLDTEQSDASNAQVSPNDATAEETPASSHQSNGTLLKHRQDDAAAEETPSASSHQSNGTVVPQHDPYDAYFDVELESNNSNGYATTTEHSRLIDKIQSLSDHTFDQPNNDTHHIPAAISNGSSSSTISSSLDVDISSITQTSADDGDNISINSSDVTFFDPELASETEPKSSSLSVDFYDCVENGAAHVVPSTVGPSGDLDQTLIVGSAGGGHPHATVASYTMIDSSDSGSESLPISQSTSLSSTFTVNSSDSNRTLQEAALLELCLLSKQQFDDDEENYGEDRNDRNSDEDTTQSTETDELLVEDSALVVNLNGGPNDDVDEGVEGIEEEADGDEEQAAENGPTDEDEFKPQRIRRCSSLKSGKTPPGTPGRKKFVRFADVLGLDLADVKTFMDEIPTVPREAYQDLVVSSDTIDGMDGVLTEAVPNFVSNAYVNKMLVPMFQQPNGNVEFLDRVRDQNVCLETAVVTDSICLTISGTVRVRNLDFHKSVHIRYSLDAWESFADFQASYVDKSCDGFSDQFSFTIFGYSLNIGQRLEMAVRFSCKGEQFWDSNYGVNYCFQCMPANRNPIPNPVTALEPVWLPRFAADEESADILPNGLPSLNLITRADLMGVSGSFY